MRAGGRGVLALSAHAFWPLKDLKFWDVVIGFDPVDHYKNNIGHNIFGHFCFESPPLHKL